MSPMPADAVLRDETPADQRIIADLTTRAFRPMPFASGAEGAIIDKLRDDGDLALSIVAERDGRIVGHVAFSPAAIGNRNDGWFALGPISVEPRDQRRGIGRALIERGLERLKSLGASGCVLIGSPELYRRFGFISDGRLTYGSLEPGYIQYRPFGGDTPTGDLKFAPAFDLDPHP